MFSPWRKIRKAADCVDDAFSLAPEYDAAAVRAEGWLFQFLALCVFILSMLVTGYIQGLWLTILLRGRPAPFVKSERFVRAHEILVAASCVLVLIALWHLGVGFASPFASSPLPALILLAAGDVALLALFFLMALKRSGETYVNEAGGFEIETTWLSCGIFRLFLLHRLRDSASGDLVHLPGGFWRREIAVVEITLRRLVLLIQDEARPLVAIFERGPGGLLLDSPTLLDINEWNRGRFDSERPIVRPGEFIRTRQSHILHSYILEGLNSPSFMPRLPIEKRLAMKLPD
jgi:hypothetical protein